MIRIAMLLFWAGALGSFALGADAVWQWSVPMGEGRAFLWIPEDCARVRGVVVGQHNMIEQGILEHATMRRTLAELGFAEVFIAPPFDRVFQFDRGAGERFDAMMRGLADASGYGELTTAPVVPMGHSACASFPWNFAAWAPARTLAVLSVKGDAPQTNLTGSGAPNPGWGDRAIDGIPGLMVMSEQEWWEDRLTPLLKYREAHPATPLAVLGDTGHGHFDATDELVSYLAMFIRKAFAARMPEVGPVSDRPRTIPEGRSETGPTLKPLDPTQGWLVDRWRGDDESRAAAAPSAAFTGDRTAAWWCFDAEMARATEACHAAGRGRARQQVGFVQAGELVPIANTHAGIELAFAPEADGVTFEIGGAFIVPLPPKAPVAAKDRPPPRTTVKPEPALPGAHSDGSVAITPITGPVVPVAANTFRVAFNRTFSTTDARGHDIWFMAGHPADGRFKGVVQQAVLHLPRGSGGMPQAIAFPSLPDQPLGVTSIQLAATSDAGLAVGYYVREGPAVVRGDRLHFTPLPPRARLPVSVTVVAWQLGRGTEPRVQEARTVERTFLLTSP